MSFWVQRRRVWDWVKWWLVGWVGAGSTVATDPRSVNVSANSVGFTGDASRLGQTWRKVRICMAKRWWQAYSAKLTLPNFSPYNGPLISTTVKRCWMKDILSFILVSQIGRRRSKLMIGSVARSKSIEYVSLKQLTSCKWESLAEPINSSGSNWTSTRSRFAAIPPESEISIFPILYYNVATLLETEGAEFCSCKWIRKAVLGHKGELHEERNAFSVCGRVGHGYEICSKGRGRRKRRRCSCNVAVNLLGL